jgi:glycerate kinase
LENSIEWADLIFTGEGSYDSQTQQGKVVSKVVEICQAHHKQLIIVCGKQDSVIDLPNVQVFDMTSVFGLDNSLHHAAETLKLLIQQPVFQLIKSQFL